MGTPMGHIAPKERSRYAQPLRRKTRLKKNRWRPLAAKPNGGGGPCRVWGAGWPRAMSCKSFVDLGPRVRPLFDFEEISKCPTTRNALFETTSITRASGKSKSDGVVNLNSSTLCVVGVADPRRVIVRGGGVNGVGLRNVTRSQAANRRRRQIQRRVTNFWVHIAVICFQCLVAGVPLNNVRGKHSPHL